MEELIKIGTVESVSGRRAKVRFKGKATSSSELTVLKNSATMTGYADQHSHGISLWVPAVGQKVVCLMLPNGNGQGFIVGAI